jgi:hypothetical protein
MTDHAKGGQRRNAPRAKRLLTRVNDLVAKGERWLADTGGGNWSHTVGQIIIDIEANLVHVLCPNGHTIWTGPLGELHGETSSSGIHRIEAPNKMPLLLMAAE